MDQDDVTDEKAAEMDLLTSLQRELDEHARQIEAASVSAPRSHDSLSGDNDADVDNAPNSVMSSDDESEDGGVQLAAMLEESEQKLENQSREMEEGSLRSIEMISDNEDSSVPTKAKRRHRSTRGRGRRINYKPAKEQAQTPALASSNEDELRIARMADMLEELERELGKKGENLAIEGIYPTSINAHADNDNSETENKRHGRRKRPLRKGAQITRDMESLEKLGPKGNDLEDEEIERLGELISSYAREHQREVKKLQEQNSSGAQRVRSIASKKGKAEKRLFDKLRTQLATAKSAIVLHPPRSDNMDAPAFGSSFTSQDDGEQRINGPQRRSQLPSSSIMPEINFSSHSRSINLQPNTNAWPQSRRSDNPFARSSESQTAAESQFSSSNTNPFAPLTHRQSNMNALPQPRNFNPFTQPLVGQRALATPSRPTNINPFAPWTDHQPNTNASTRAGNINPLVSLNSTGITNRSEPSPPPGAPRGPRSMLTAARSGSRSNEGAETRWGQPSGRRH